MKLAQALMASVSDRLLHAIGHAACLATKMTCRADRLGTAAIYLYTLFPLSNTIVCPGIEQLYRNGTYV